MKLARKFKLISQKLVDEEADIRHSLLDVFADFEEATHHLEDIPDYLREEINQLKKEMELIQPQFPSHRKTSVLFDHEGLGQKGLLKAKEIARMIISVYKRLEKME
jgi:histone acetyltransferase (RNA polymerase elongator complex component)